MQSGQQEDTAPLWFKYDENNREEAWKRWTNIQGDASKAVSKEAQGMYKYFTEQGDLDLLLFPENYIDMNKARSDAAMSNSDAKGPTIKSDDTEAQKKAAAELYYYMHKEEIERAKLADQLGAIQPANIEFEALMAFASLKSVVMGLKNLGGLTDDAIKAGNQIVLGRYPAYVNKANELGAKVFNIPKTIWDKMGDAEKWAANKKFLDRAIARGDEIVLASPLSDAKIGTFFRKEIDYLTSQGFKLSKDGLKMIRP